MYEGVTDFKGLQNGWNKNGRCIFEYAQYRLIIQYFATQG